MKKIAILLENSFDERELIYPYYRLLAAGYEVDLVGTDKDTVYSGKSTFTEKSTHAADEVSADDYAGVVIPGGFSPDFMRRNQATLDFVAAMDKQDKLIAAICHGPWVMASVCDLKGVNITSFMSIKDDLVNAGANYLDEEVVVDKNLVTSRTPKDLPIFMETVIKELEK